MAGSFRVSQLWLFTEADSPLLDLFNVKYVLTDRELAGKWKPVYRDPDGMAVYENQAVMPRAFVVYGAETVAGADESLARLTGGAFDYRTTVLLEGDGVSSARSDAPFDPNAAVITRYEPERVEVAARAAGDGFLVLADSYDPGWRAELDGRPARVYVADHAFRAVALPAGEHRVVFTYDPPVFKIGLVISLLTWMGAIGAGVGLAVANRRRRREACG
jgi:hypothetical protein